MEIELRSQSMPTIFVSYRRDDAAYVADMIRTRIVAEFGKNSVFMDVDNVPIGRDFREHIKSAVECCDALLAVIGDNWFAVDPVSGKRRIDNPEDFVHIEVHAALVRGIPVVPVLVGRARVPALAELPDKLKPLTFRNAVEVRAGQSLPSQLDILARRLRETFSADARSTRRSRNAPRAQVRQVLEAKEKSERPSARGTEVPEQQEEVVEPVDPERFERRRFLLVAMIVAVVLATIVTVAVRSCDPCRSLAIDERPISCLGE
jgi:hypothetical protein